MAIHSDHNRKRKGLTQEDLPNIPSASHSRAAEGCAEFQCILPRPTLISMPVPSLSWISSLEGPLLPYSPQGLTLCWVFYAQEDLFFLAFEKTQPQSPASPAQCWELQSPDFYVHFFLLLLCLLSSWGSSRSIWASHPASLKEKPVPEPFPRLGQKWRLAVVWTHTSDALCYEGTSGVSPRASRSSLK